MKNEISVVLPEEEFNSILTRIDSIDGSMPFLINLPEEKRQGGFKLGDKKKFDGCWRRSGRNVSPMFCFNEKLKITGSSFYIDIRKKPRWEKVPVRL